MISKRLVLLTAAIITILTGAFSSFGQNLTAAQMNIYFGQPKRATVTNNQGTVTTEFDREGRVLRVAQGNMRMEYNWSSNGKTVTITAYQGQNVQDSGVIEISEFSKSVYKYTMGDVVQMTVSFNNNGAMENIKMVNPQMSATTTYFYRNPKDMFPYAIEQTMGDQSIKGAISIDKTDAVGNAIEYTQEAMGMKNITKVSIEYY